MVLEKKRVTSCLVELAAEAVAMELEHTGSIKVLKIPRTLMDNVYVKLKDWELIRQDLDESLLLDSTFETDHENEDAEDAFSDQDEDSEK